MTENICPICNAPVKLHDRVCGTCGVDLALATITTERAIFDTGVEISPDMVVSPEVLVPRLGDHLVEQGYLTDDQLQAALSFQQEQSKDGNSVLLGKALIHLGYIDQKTLDAAITQQIFHLQDALRKANRDLEARVAERTKDLQLALNRLSELNQLKANFVANISHELRTPLTHIKGYTEMLRDSSLGPITDDQGVAFQVMGRSINRLESLINDLIRFSDSSHTELSIHLQPLPPAYVVKHAYIQAKQKTAHDGIQFELQVADDLPNMLCDQEKISWVILHLIENAVKFTPNGGKITVGAVRINHQICISIEDTGIGIPHDKLEEIFEPFHQLDASTTRQFAGTGLGLALVKRIVTAHQSAVKVESTPGKGSKFSFCLPVTEQKLMA